MSNVIHVQYLPSFGLGLEDQSNVCLYTILLINDAVGDCAAYQGVAPSPADEPLIERIMAGGQKIREDEARAMFDEIEHQNLRYRR